MLLAIVSLYVARLLACLLAAVAAAVRSPNPRASGSLRSHHVVIVLVHLGSRVTLAELRILGTVVVPLARMYSVWSSGPFVNPHHFIRLSIFYQKLTQKFEILFAKIWYLFPRKKCSSYLEKFSFKKILLHCNFILNNFYEFIFCFLDVKKCSNLQSACIIIFKKFLFQCDHILKIL